MAQHQFVFDAIGTTWKIDIDESMTTRTSASLLVEIQKRIEQFDHDYSRFRADSLVTTMAKTAGTYILPPDAEPLFSLYQELFVATRGAFTPLIGSVLVEAGYDATYTLRPSTLHQPPSWDEVIAYHYPRLTLKRPVLLDFGAAGKGYLIDIVSTLLRESGVQSFCVDAGGDIYYHHKKNDALRVGLEHPQALDEVIGVATIVNQSICGSAGNRRAWANFHHTIDPFTLTSPQHILATWVVAHTTIIADALTTCLFLVPRKEFVVSYSFEYAILYADFSLEKSAAFPAEFFLSPTQPL